MTGSSVAQERELQLGLPKLSRKARTLRHSSNVLALVCVWWEWQGRRRGSGPNGRVASFFWRAAGGGKFDACIEGKMGKWGAFPMVPIRMGWLQANAADNKKPEKKARQPWVRLSS